jgi:hypothetical protein
MENISVLRRPGFSNYNIPGNSYYTEKITEKETGLYTEKSKLNQEDLEDLFQYLENFNLSAKPDLLILYPKNHYYYDEDDLKNVGTLINLKKLNHIKDLDEFLRTLVNILPPDVSFIGCFSESKTKNWIGFFSGLSSRFVDLLDLKTNRNMKKNEVSELLTKYGFKVVDMTEMKGLTYFYSQVVPQSLSA